MSHIVSLLTAENAAPFGITRNPEKDTLENGVKIEAFSYKGLPIRQAIRPDGKVNVITYVCLMENNFTNLDWKNMEDHVYESCFYGSSEINLEDLVKNMDKILALREELNNSVTVTENEAAPVIDILKAEAQKVEAFLQEMKSTIELWRKGELQSWDAIQLVKTLEVIARDCRYESENFNELPMYRKRTLVQALQFHPEDIVYATHYMNLVKRLM